MLGKTLAPMSRGAMLGLTILYAVGFLIVLASVGPGEAARRFLAEWLLLLLWLVAAGFLLPTVDMPFSPIRRPGQELWLGAAGLAALAAGAALRFSLTGWGRSVLALVGLGVPLAAAVLVGQRYGRRALGLTWGPRRGWLALLAVVVINVLFSQLAARLLPPGELPVPPGEDLSQSITGALDVLLLTGQLLLIAALPEELFFRVYLLPRLAHYLPVAWAILAQALLFSAVHLPRALLLLHYSWPLALADILSFSNGVIGGFFWWKTRSLPLLLALHLFAYIRFGL